MGSFSLPRGPSAPRYQRGRNPVFGPWRNAWNRDDNAALAGRTVDPKPNCENARAPGQKAKKSREEKSKNHTMAVDRRARLGPGWALADNPAPKPNQSERQKMIGGPGKLIPMGSDHLNVEKPLISLKW